MTNGKAALIRALIALVVADVRRYPELPRPGAHQRPRERGRERP